MHRSQPAKPAGSRDKESGQVLVIVVAFMVAAIMLTALTADLGFVLVERRNLQNAADAAALAGAQALPHDTDAAVANAKSYAAKNGLESDQIESVTISTTDYPNDTIRVKVKGDVGFVLAKVMGMVGTGVKAKASARTGSLVGAAALAPLGVEQSVFDGLEPGDQATLKYNATNSTDGNFMPLVMDQTGSSEYEQNLMNGSATWLCSQGNETEGCVSVLDTQPGNVIGGTRQALTWIFANTSKDCDSYDEVFSSIDPDTGYGNLNPDCNRYTSPSAASYRVLLVPVISNLCNGSCQVTILEFALFFIESYSCSGGGEGNSCNLVGRYAKADTDIQGAIGTYDPNSTVKFVRLVE